MSGWSRVAGFVVLAVTGCAAGKGLVPMQVRSETSPTADLAAYRTFGWLQPPLASNGAQDKAELFDWKLRNAVDAGLLEKGYLKGTDGRADFLVVYDVSLKNKNTEAFSEWFEYRARGGKQGLGNAFMDGYQEGTLVLQVVDGRDRALVWRGSASAVIDPGTGDGRRLDEAVRRLLERFPARG